jgi:hypothetical protein
VCVRALCLKDRLQLQAHKTTLPFKGMRLTFMQDIDDAVFVILPLPVFCPLRVLASSRCKFTWRWSAGGV